MVVNPAKHSRRRAVAWYLCRQRTFRWFAHRKGCSDQRLQSALPQSLGESPRCDHPRTTRLIAHGQVTAQKSGESGSTIEAVGAKATGTLFSVYANDPEMFVSTGRSLTAITFSCSVAGVLFGSLIIGHGKGYRAWSDGRILAGRTIRDVAHQRSDRGRRGTRIERYHQWRVVPPTNVPMVTPPKVTALPVTPICPAATPWLRIARTSVACRLVVIAACSEVKFSESASLTVAAVQAQWLSRFRCNWLLRRRP